MTDTKRLYWGVQWRSRNALDGERRYLISGADYTPALFRTRSQARAFIDQRFGYIRTRQDLREEPHGWRLPRAVRVVVEVRT